MHPDRDILDFGIRVYIEAVSLGQLLDPFGDRSHIQAEEVLARLGAQNNILGHGKRLDQFKMLMHHPDSEFVRDIRIRDPHVLAVDFDYATVRLIHAKQDTHQGGLACPVLTSGA